jgi:hypothetical protein
MDKLRALLAWFLLHPRIKAAVQFLGAALGLIGIVIALFFHFQDQSKFQAAKTAEKVREAAAQVAQKQSAAQIRAALCPLVYGYVHPVPGTALNGRAAQVNSLWHAVGALVGCPNGERP